MTTVYHACPQFVGTHYSLRLVTPADAQDLLAVYSDPRAVPLFNSDNCGGDDFHYTTLERMQAAVTYWLAEYAEEGFVRWSIIANKTQTVIGTIELFHREAADYFTNCGVLRLDLRSDYEQTEAIAEILALIVAPAFSLFDCSQVATKAVPAATERIAALQGAGFTATAEQLIGHHDGTAYADYWVRRV
ncbi:N-acetyltransferase [Schleiferilactobacillus harbinensis]|uniref:GNAT family N-acetyltransferase n=1 Tax=Schleiferilactobacillus harbinensis TaxID=304207 RepID=UPI0021A4217A|nr:GNAT family protein [Schleiferilactobacillus harbinensis]MCT2907646.1 N-acetyltransferase [Schleiferilactobacillus harbinensis]